MTEPEDCEQDVGAYGEFTVEATGVGSYLWQYSKDGGTTWNKAAGTNNEATYSVYVTETRYGFLYRCELTGTDGTSKIHTQTVKLVPASIVVEDVVYKKLTDTTCAIVGYQGTATSIEIPDSVEGMTVTEVGEEAFMNNTTLQSIDLPDTITVIRARAFKGCSSLNNMK